MVAALVAAAVAVFFIVLDPGGGREEFRFVASARSVAQKVERMPVPPFDEYRLTNVTYSLAPDGRHATCDGVEKRAGDRGAGAGNIFCADK